MSKDNYAVSLDMLRSQLLAMENAVDEALQKRRQSARQLRELVTSDANPAAMTILTALDTLARTPEAARTNALRRWSTCFPDDMTDIGLRQVFVSGSETIRIWDQARAIFGHRVGMELQADPREVLTACQENEDCVGVLGWMTHAGSGQWWPILNETRYHSLRIIGAWPVFGEDKPSAAVIANGPIKAGVGKSTILIAHDDHHKVDRIFAEHDLPVSEFGRARSLVLFEIPAGFDEEDPRLDAARKAGLDGLRVVGALPL